MKTKTKRPLKVLGYVVLAILVFLVIVCISVFIQTKINPNRIPSIFGYKPFVVLSNSMESEISKGDLVVTKEVNVDTLKENDIIAFRDDENHVVTHRIVGTVKGANGYQLITKGDNNYSSDSGSVDLKDVEGKYLFKIGGLGNMVLVIQEPITLGIILLIIFGVGAFWIAFGNNKLSKEEKRELEKLRKEKGKKGG